ncbi:MAG: hypothetical protein HXY41_09365 [Chloroflexi bacterium]|nr:hypothetical protein [Chloroflexota bacterium]
MTQAQAEQAIQEMYGDISARDELTDDEAGVLLAWGEQQITALAALDLDDESFQAACQHLTKLLSRINRFSARRAALPPEEAAASLDKIAQSAESLAAFRPGAQAFVRPGFALAADLDPIGTIRALTEQIAPAITGEPHDQTNQPGDEAGRRPDQEGQSQAEQDEQPPNGQPV